MASPIDIQLIRAKDTASPVLLSIGYNAGHVVVQLESIQAVERILLFISEHRSGKGAHWTEIGRFSTCAVTLYLGCDLIAVIVDTDLTVDSFGQSAGIHIPRHLLDELTRALEDEHKRFSESAAA